MAEFSYDLSTNTGKVRMLIPDSRAADRLFTDDEIETILALEGSDVRRAAALALETVASDQARMLKWTKVQGVEVDGTKSAAELRARAKQLRELAAEGDPSSSSDDVGFAIAQRPTTEHGYDTLIYREALKDTV